MDKTSLTCRKTIRLSKDLNDRLEAKAAEAGISKSEIWRVLAENYLSDEGEDKVQIINKDTMRVMVGAVNKLGNNVNQFVRRINVDNLTGKINDETYLKSMPFWQNVANKLDNIFLILKLNGRNKS